MTQLKNNFDPNQKWFENLTVALDMGYLGFKTTYPDTKESLVPIRRLPRRGKNLLKTEEELFPQAAKDYNTMVSKIRVFVENAIGGAKRFFALVNRCRNRLAAFRDGALLVAAGIWNLHLDAKLI